MMRAGRSRFFVFDISHEVYESTNLHKISAYLCVLIIELLEDQGIIPCAPKPSEPASNAVKRQADDEDELNGAGDPKRRRLVSQVFFFVLVEQLIYVFITVFD